MKKFSSHLCSKGREDFHLKTKHCAYACLKVFPCKNAACAGFTGAEKSDASGYCLNPQSTPPDIDKK
jgi:hypothetical protein